MSLIQLLKFRTWETRLFKMPRFDMPRFQMGTRVTVASGPSIIPIKAERLRFTNKSMEFSYFFMKFPKFFNRISIK